MGNKNVQLAEFISPEKKQKKQIKIPKPEIDLSTLDKNLLVYLKNWRNQQARKSNVPAYIIFANKTLEQIASLKPHTEDQLLTV